MSASITVETECGTMATRVRGPQGYSSGQPSPTATEAAGLRYHAHAHGPRTAAGWDLRTDAFAAN